MYLQKKGNRGVPSGNQKLIYGNALPGVLGSDLTTKDQVEDLIQEGITSDLENNNIAFTGNNTHSGTETFTNSAGVTTDTITPATSGAGTIVKRPAAIFTTTPIAAASVLSNGVYGLSKADGIAITLPTLSTANIGYTIRFHILTSSTSVGYVFSAAATNVMVGGLWATIASPDAANDMEFNIADGTENTLTLGATTAAGLAGGYVEFTAISATQWAVNGTVLGSGTIASDLFTTV